MSLKPIYENYVQFIPQNADVHRTPSIRLVKFESNCTSKNKITSKAYNEAENQNILDSYALRNHWEIFNMEIEFKNKPWDGWNELYNKVHSFKGVNCVKNVEKKLYIDVNSDKNQEVRNKLKNYYGGLKPARRDFRTIEINVEPVYR